MKKIDGREYPIRKEDKAEYEAWKKTRPAKIHAIYEGGMLETDAVDALNSVNDELKEKAQVPQIESGFDAAYQVAILMNDSCQRLSPKHIIEVDDPSLTTKVRATKVWKDVEVKEGTIASLADSVRLLAAMWESAWRKGNGGRLSKEKLIQFKEQQLERVYRGDRNFLPSLCLEQMVKSADFEPSPLRPY